MNGYKEPTIADFFKLPFLILGSMLAILWLWFVEKTRRYRLLRFAVVGGIGVPINLGILYGLTEMGLHYAVSAFLAIMIAMTINYVLNHHWTFKDRQGSNKSLFRGWLKYAVVSGIGDGLYLGLMVLLTEILDLWYIASAIAALATIMIARYLVVSKIIWGKIKC